MGRVFRYDIRNFTAVQQPLLPHQRTRAPPPNWIATFAQRHLEDGVGLVIASPCMESKPYPDRKLAAYRENMAALLNCYPNDSRLFVLRSYKEIERVNTLFGCKPLPHIRLREGKIDAVALLPSTGSRKIGDPGLEAIVKFMGEFTDKCSSFLLAGGTGVAEVARKALFEYLVNRGMQGKQIASDTRFTYPEKP